MRFFSPWDARQQKRSPIVYSEASLRKIMTQAAISGGIASIILGDNFDITRTVNIMAALAGLEIAGAPGVKLRAKTGADPAIVVNADKVWLHDFDLEAQTSTGIGISVPAGGDHSRIERVDFLEGASAFATGVSVDRLARAKIGSVAIEKCGFECDVAVDSAATGTIVERCRRGSGSHAAACSMAPGLRFWRNIGMDVEVSSAIGADADIAGQIQCCSGCRVVLGANTAYHSVVGNTNGDLFGVAAASIDSSASAGHNVIDGNSGGWVITAAGTDVTGDNT